MGSEDLFHKKREQNARDFARKKSTRSDQPKILIVCEDSKSSAYYFEDIKKDFGLTAVVVEGERSGSAPISVVAFAISEYEKSKKEDKFDRIYCVFDRDRHDSYDEAIQKINSLTPKNRFFAITTTPCFEFWLLIHFGYTSASFVAKGKKSSCDCAGEQLRATGKLPEYDKCKRQIYILTKEKLPDAINNAKRLVQENLKTQSSDPQTNMHELIEYLQSIKR